MTPCQSNEILSKAAMAEQQSSMQVEGRPEEAAQATEARGFLLPDYGSSDEEVEFTALQVPSICFRVILGASPMDKDEEAIIGAFMEKKLGALAAKKVEASIFTKSMSMKYEAVKTWPVLALQVWSVDVYRKLMSDYPGAPLVNCEVYAGCRELALGPVLLPSCQKKKKVAVAYVREGREQYLPQAPPLGRFQGAGLLISLRVTNTLGLQLSNCHLNRLAGGLVMEGSKKELSSDKGMGGGAWAHECAGVRVQLEAQGLLGEVVKAHDRSSGQHKCALQPWGGGGTKLEGLHRGASMQLRITRAVGAGGGVVDPEDEIPSFLLAAEVGFALDAKPITEDKKVWDSKLCSLPVKVAVAASTGYTAVAVEDSAGAPHWLVGPAEGGAVPAGFHAAAKPKREKKAPVPEFVVEKVKEALRETGNRHVEERGVGPMCVSFFSRAWPKLVKRTQGVSGWEAHLEVWCEEAVDPSSSFGRLAACPADACCQRRRYPCALFGGAEAAATAAALRQVSGDYVSIQAAPLALGEVSGAGGIGGGRGGGPAGKGGGGRGDKRAKREPGEVVAVKPLPARGLGAARGRDRGKAPSGGAAADKGGGESEDGGSKKRKSDAESEVEGWELRPSAVGWGSFARELRGKSLEGAGDTVAWASLDRGPTPSPVYQGQTDESITTRLSQLNAEEDCTLNEKVFEGSAVKEDQVKMVNGVLGVLQQRFAGRSKAEGWCLDEFEAAVQVYARQLPGGSDAASGPEATVRKAVTTVVRALRDVGLAVVWGTGAKQRFVVLPMAWASPE